MHLQLFDKEFQKKAGAAAVVRAPQYPARGLIYDRNGQLLIHNNPIYDLMVTYSQVKPGMDTARFCNLLGIMPEYFQEALKKKRLTPIIIMKVHSAFVLMVTIFSLPAVTVRMVQEDVTSIYPNVKATAGASHSILVHR